MARRKDDHVMVFEGCSKHDYEIRIPIPEPIKVVHYGDSLDVAPELPFKTEKHYRFYAHFKIFNQAGEDIFIWQTEIDEFDYLRWRSLPRTESSIVNYNYISQEDAKELIKQVEARK